MYKYADKKPPHPEEITANTDLPKRKRIRSEHYDYSKNGAYFVTVRTADKKAIFWKNAGADIIRPQKHIQIAGDVPLSEYGKTVETAIQKIHEHYSVVTVGKYCIMPNHTHMIIFIAAKGNGRIISATILSTAAGQVKRWASKQTGISIWQKSFCDEIIRNQAAYDEISEYIFENPIKWDEDELFTE